MIDFHSHMLPSIDDGSGSVEESLQMLQTSAQQGVQQICLTSHFYAAENSPEHFLERRQWAYIKLCEALKECTFDVPQLHLGAEVHYFEGIHRLKQLPSLMLEGTNILLLEMPFTQWSKRMIVDVLELQESGQVCVMLAHVERYLRMQDKSVWDKLLRAGVVMQSNAGFFLKWTTRRRALQMLREGRIHVLASDSHNMHSRPPRMEEAWNTIRKSLGEDALRRLEHREQKLLQSKVNTL